jgi:uncharacterized membrane protein
MEGYRHLDVPRSHAGRRVLAVLPSARALLLLAVVFAGGVLAKPARADFTMCNNTGSRVGVSIGFKDPEGWVTEGWWNLSARSCETLLKGNLIARYYYIYAVDYDRGGEWSGQAFMCTREKEFTIRGVEDCLARGFDRTGFFEVDTGEQRAWTVQLTDAGEQGGTRPNMPGMQMIPMPAPGRNAPPMPGPAGR